jgi:type II secretory pathway component PulF
MNTSNPINYFGIVILGLALLWAVRLVYGRRRGASNDLVKRCLLLAGWILIVGGVLTGVGMSLPFFPLPLLGLVIVAMAYFKYMTSERRSLLWALALAAEKDIPLEKAARSFADERSVQVGVRVSSLADLLEAGIPLPTAMAMSRNSLPTDALLASRIGQETGQMGPALRMSIRYSDDFELVMRHVLVRYFYLLGVLTAAGWIMTFMMLKIAPVMTKMFEEFELELPGITRLVIGMSRNFIVFGPLMHLALLGLSLIGISYYCRWSRYELPFLSRLWRRCDGALIMRTLSLTVSQGRELGPTLAKLSQQYPLPSIGKRLESAAKRIESGIHWCDALMAAGLLNRAESAVLKTAERFGNLEWALGEMSDSALRRFSFRLRAVLNIAFPLILLICGFVVFVFVVGMFLPLVSLIQGLS